MYDALNLIDQEKYEDAKNILLKEEKNITEISKLCTIYNSMLEISSATNNNSDGAKYSELLKKCYTEGSNPYVFLEARVLYFKGNYDKTDRILNKLSKKISNELSEGDRTEIHDFMDKNILSSIYILKASILLINNEPEKVKKEVIYLAEQAYAVKKLADTNTFLAAIYHLYGDTNHSKSLIENSNDKTRQSHAFEAVLKSIKQKIDLVP
ncbi:hypothetical protein BKE30_12130 [Alkanindiges hydrocarboniclasticus]|uniref:Tetratricopeptide repeat protein n=2 Tax=Alkanindiges hydrocarboniclasticus TaxID=1907941 RepID=A0A1S8CU17_9GAMM|nr:hypothetical protein BKE30_12130 [Alkanindiges hydrocarboniclasticus]